MTEVQEKVEVQETQVATEVVRTESSTAAVEEVQRTEAQETPAEVQQEQVQEDDDNIEWSQAPKAKAPIVDDETNPKIAPEAALETVKSEKQALEARVQQLESQISMLLSDPLVKSYHEYLGSTDTPKPSEFLSRVGAVVHDPYANLQGDELVKKYYESKAKSLGLSGEELEEAVEEELSEYQSSSILRKKELEAEAKQKLSGEKKAGSLEELENEFQQSRKKQTEEDIAYLKANNELIVDFLNKVVERGTFNGRPIDSKWKSRILKGLENSYDVFNPDFVRYTEPDKDGKSYLYAPDVVEMMDFVLHKEEIKKSTKRKVDSANADTLEDKAKAAHELEIQTEKIKTKASEGDMSWFDHYKNNVSKDGSMHPNDPRRKN
jgi:hypothetical protein